ncbi:MAG: hypothetical protein WCE33_07435 [Nitrososphaeraceae archaeon]
MTNKKIIDSNELTKLLQDPILVRIVSIIGNTSLSILELLEYNLTRKDVNYALSSGVIVIDKPSSSSRAYLDYSDVSLDDNNILVSGDYYFYNFLSSKVKLIDLGIYILETIKAENRILDNEIPNDIGGPQQQYFSGDTLFVNGVRRPDPRDNAKEFAAMLYETLHNSILPMEDNYNNALL